MDQNYPNEFPEVPSTSKPSPPPPPRAVAPPSPIPVYMPAPGTARPPRRSLAAGFFRLLFIVLLFGSVVLNLYLIGLVAAGVQEREYLPGDKTQKIALIDLAGSIDMNSAHRLRYLLKQAGADKHVKGVILVVNSPGGQVSPSEMMHVYLQNFRLTYPDKKLYVSIQQVAASGAYWAAVAGEKLYAQTNSVVGSIGVLYVNLVMEKTFREKLGIEPIVIKSSRSPYKDMGSLFRLPTDEEQQKIVRDIDRIHTRFVEAVSRQRPLTQDETWQLADGDIFDGPDAQAKKLIDAVGFLEDVIDDLADALNLDDPMVIRIEMPPTLKEMLAAGGLGPDNPLQIRKQLEKWASTPRIQALWLGR